MAEANPLAEKINRKLLECSICIEIFRDPRALPCHHGFCRHCLEQLVHSSRDKRILVCPTCRKTHKLPKNGVKDLPVHFHLSSLQDTVATEMKVMPSSDTHCGNCNSKKATVRCLDCMEYLCATCYAPHKFLKSLKNHTVVPIADILAGKVNLKVVEDKYCKVHGKMLEYYCKTERKAVCQDCVILKDCKAEHDRLTLDEAATMQSSELQGLQKKCNITLKNYQEAVKITEDVKRDLEKNSQLAKQSLENVRKDCIKQVDKMVKKHEAEIDNIKIERLKELDKQQTTLESTMRQIQKAKEDTTRVTESGSKYEVISTHAALSTQLQKLAQSQPIAVEKSLGYVKFKAAIIPVVLSIGQLLVGNWKLTDRFKTGDFNGLQGLAIDQNGDIALTSLDKGLKVYSRSGEVKCTLSESLGAFDIAVTRDCKYVTPRIGQDYFKIQNRQGRVLSTIPITDVNDDPSDMTSVAIDTEGRILVGQYNNTISIHHPDGSLISKFATQSKPFRLATTSNGEIVSSFYDTALKRCTSLRLMDYFGGNVRVIQPPPDVKLWKPGSVCCKQGEIFVVNGKEGDPTGVYRYTSEGEYLDCITTNVRHPTGIALSEDGMEFFVAERHKGMVKIFQREQL